MKYLLTFLLCVPGISVIAQEKVSYVDPLIGSQGMGHTFPGACVPFGAVQLSPDTDTIPHNVDGVYQKDVYRYCAGYQYEDPTIVGFSHTHFNGTGHSDLGDILLMPTTGTIRLNPGQKDSPQHGYRSRFSHDTERSAPGYYRAFLDDYQIQAELTATERVGVHRYTYPKGEGNVILDLLHGIYNYDGKVLWANVRVENDTLLTGFRYTNGWARMNQTYFAISFSKPIKHYGGQDISEQIPYKGFWRKFDTTNNFPEMAGRKLKCFFVFDLTDGATLEVKVALSGVSTEGALKNLEQETAGKDFHALQREASGKWEKALSVMEVKGSQEHKKSFYTSLYHTMINPSVYMDVDGKYRGVDQNIHQAENFTNYTVFSLWDTFRAQHPLLNLMVPSRSGDMQTSLLQHARQSVHQVLPVWSHMANENWCMIGYHGVSVLSDGITKETGSGHSDVLRAMQKSSTLPYYDGIADYMQLGYVPAEKNAASASMTLEYAYDDWTIYQAAKRMGEEEIAADYKKRARNYRHLFFKDGYVRPRAADGDWRKDFNIYDTHGQGFIEGNSLNYSFFVPHDVKGLIEKMGGEKEFIRRLDLLFTEQLSSDAYQHTEDVTKEGILGSYVHGNEPSHHIPYLYMWTNRPWKTADRIRQIFDVMYKNSYDGLCGNDDCGQMSAWYVFSAMGFYPVCPGSEQYVFGIPLFEQTELNLENGRKFRIQTENFAPENKYIQQIYLNGKKYKKAFIRHSDILNGGELKFVMGRKPVGDFVEERPYSLMDEDLD